MKETKESKVRRFFLLISLPCCCFIFAFVFSTFFCRAVYTKKKHSLSNRSRSKNTGPRIYRSKSDKGKGTLINDSLAMYRSMEPHRRRREIERDVHTLSRPFVCAFAEGTRRTTCSDPLIRLLRALICSRPGPLPNSSETLERRLPFLFVLLLRMHC